MKINWQMFFVVVLPLLMQLSGYGMIMFGDNEVPLELKGFLWVIVGLLLTISNYQLVRDDE